MTTETIRVRRGQRDWRKEWEDRRSSCNRAGVTMTLPSDDCFHPASNRPSYYVWADRLTRAIKEGVTLPNGKCVRLAGRVSADGKPVVSYSALRWFLFDCGLIELGDSPPPNQRDDVRIVCAGFEPTTGF